MQYSCRDVEIAFGSSRVSVPSAGTSHVPRSPTSTPGITLFAEETYSDGRTTAIRLPPCCPTSPTLHQSTSASFQDQVIWALWGITFLSGDALLLSFTHTHQFHATNLLFACLVRLLLLTKSLL